MHSNDSVLRRKDSQQAIAKLKLSILPKIFSTTQMYISLGQRHQFEGQYSKKRFSKIICNRETKQVVLLITTPTLSPLESHATMTKFILPLPRCMPMRLCSIPIVIKT